jgi:hypothetical protein
MCTCKHVDGCTSYKESLPTRFHSGWTVSGEATFEIKNDAIFALLPLQMKLEPVVREKENIPCANCQGLFKPREAKNLYCSNDDCKRAQRRIKKQKDRARKAGRV